MVPTDAEGDQIDAEAGARRNCGCARGRSVKPFTRGECSRSLPETSVSAAACLNPNRSPQRG